MTRNPETAVKAANRGPVAADPLRSGTHLVSRITPKRATGEDRIWSDAVLRARRRLLAAQRTLAPVLATTDDPAEVEALIRAAVDAALDELVVPDRRPERGVGPTSDRGLLG